MNATEIVVVVGGTAVIAALAWYFFAPRKAVGAQLEGGRQVVDITVRSGYSPNLVRIEAGKPVRCASTGRRTATARPGWCPRPAQERDARRVRHHHARPGHHRAR